MTKKRARQYWKIFKNLSDMTDEEATLCALVIQTLNKKAVIVKQRKFA